jgi:hypothetical protein
VASKFILLELPSPVTERPAVFSYPFNVSELEVSATRFDDEVCFVSVVLLSFVLELEDACAVTEDLLEFFLLLLSAIVFASL